jgi:1,4-alpha-glucan branching enzyme
VTLPAGVFCPVLHAHLPYVPLETGDFGLEETWLFEATAECYLPLLGVFDRLTRDNVPWSLALNVSPTLLALWRHPRFFERCGSFLERVAALAEEHEKELEQTPLASAMAFNRRFLDGARTALARDGRDLTAAFRRFADAGHVELLASAATHAVLPLLTDRPECVRAQVRVGIESYRRAFGREPRGFWLPECAYGPDVEPHLADAGILFSIVDAHGIDDADPRPLRGTERPILSPGGVAFFGRDTRTARQVWNASEGFPADPRYREFHSDLGFELPQSTRARHGLGAYSGPLGLKLRRVTGRRAEVVKEPYDHSTALEVALRHAEEFVAGLVRSSAARRAGPAPTICLSAYDAELLGHWWFEGPFFLEAVFRRLAEQDEVVARTPDAFLAEWPECEVALPGTSSWGRGGYFEMWLSPDAEDIPPRLREAAERLIRLAAGPRRDDTSSRALDQAARELLLAQASDWPFVLAMKTTVDHARARFEDHVAQVHDICTAVERGTLDERTLARRAERYSPFPFLDHRVYTLSRDA